MARLEAPTLDRRAQVTQHSGQLLHIVRLSRALSETPDTLATRLITATRHPELSEATIHFLERRVTRSGGSIPTETVPFANWFGEQNPPASQTVFEAPQPSRPDAEDVAAKWDAALIRDPDWVRAVAERFPNNLSAQAAIQRYEAAQRVSELGITLQFNR